MEIYREDSNNEMEVSMYRDEVEDEVEDEKVGVNEGLSLTPQMVIAPFETLKITTMTMIIALSDSVNTDIAFQLLPITRIAIQQTRQSAKCKLPHCEIPGSMLSMRCGGNVRGIIRSKSSPFKNAVTIDISTRQKNISLKLSSLSIQMCGASSRDDGIEAARYLLGHLSNIQMILDKIQNNERKCVDEIEWVKKLTKGEMEEKPNWNERKFANVKMYIYSPIKCHKIVKPQVPIPETLDKDMILFLVSLWDDFIYHEDLCRKLDYVGTLHKIMNSNIEIKSIDEAMVNYNYPLGFEVDRERLNQYIDGKNGFISRYNNALTTSVTIELPYEPRVGTSIKIRKNKVPHHTFLCYRSGSITQSGPGGELMKEAYYLFMNTIAQLRPYIEYSPKIGISTQ